ncbi:replication protein, partial [Enterococcus faecalis]
LSTGDKRQLLRDMIEFINENNIVHLVDFTNYWLSEKSPAGWFEILTERNTLFLKEYIKSKWQKNKDV